MSYVSIDAPAKINLRLKVVGKRADGYHFLSMLNEKLSLMDRLHINAKGAPQKYKDDFAIKLVCPSDPSLECESNLVVKAARALAKKYNVQTPLEIAIDKKIPMGGGLGGGSSDAAAALVALNKLWGLYKTPDELSEVGVSMGADVPFFFWRGPAKVSGIGEKVCLNVKLPKLWVILVNPGFGVATKWVYESLDLKLTENIENDSFPPIFNDLADLAPFVENDLEKVVVKKYKEIEQVKKYLAFCKARIVFMSGSGSTVVGLFETKRDRDLAFLENRKSSWKLFPAEN